GLQLVLEREAISLFHLDRGNASRGESLKPGKRGVDELLFRASTQIAHRRVNSSATAGDFHVIEPRSAQLLFVEARPAEQRMRVRVDESRREHAPQTIQLARGRVAPAELCFRADRRD